MREIKFRQWLKGFKKFHYFEFTEGHCEGVVSASLNEDIIMQYTGFKDKNGKLIFEGDIVGDQSFYDDKTLWKGIVYWHDKLACWYVKCTKSNTIQALHDNEFTLLEVIGDVYTNPELLK